MYVNEKTLAQTCWMDTEFGTALMVKPGEHCTLSSKQKTVLV